MAKGQLLGFFSPILEGRKPQVILDNHYVFSKCLLDVVTIHYKSELYLHSVR